MNKVLIPVSILCLLACQEPRKKTNEENKEQTRRIDNLYFRFPSSGYAYENRESLVNQCLEAVNENATLIKLDQYKKFITIHFLRSREEMKQYTGITPSGIAMVDLKTVYIVANGQSDQVKPPIKHELMHMMAMTSWGYPEKSSNWMNEGLATLAENNCNGYKVEEIYRYLLDKKMLIPVEDLANEFYKQPEMIAYHQAAFVVQYLLKYYGIEKFKQLWIKGFAGFQEIYSNNFQEVKRIMDSIATKHYPAAPEIDWEKFQKGCFP